MSDDRVIDLAARRRPVDAAPISGTVTFTNAQLRIPLIKLHHPPHWIIADAVAQIDGRSAPLPMDVSLVDVSLDDPGTPGWLDQLDDRLAGEVAIGEAYMAIIGQAALSPVSVEIVLGFSALGDGQIEELRMSIERVNKSGK